MTRIDKYDGRVGGFRAPINAAFNGTDVSNNVAYGVGLNSSGKVVKGAGTTGIVGVLVLTTNKAANDIVDVMTAGEMVEFAGAAGTIYTADTTTGAIGTTAADATHIRVGHTVEATRLIVRV